MADDRAYREAQRRIEGAIRSNATDLDLSNMQLSELPEAVGRLSHLRILYLFNNQLVALPESMGGLSQLVVLNLNDNQLLALPDSMGGLARLQELLLARNRLTRLPASLGRLADLRTFWLSHNPLAALPDWMTRLAEMRVLALSHMALTSVPDWVGGLTRLQVLLLQSNQLGSLPESVGLLSRLEELYLEGNDLQALPKSIRKLRKLNRLYLHGNPKLGLPDEALGPRAGDYGTPMPPSEILDYYFSHQRSGGFDSGDYDVFVSSKSEDYPRASEAATILRAAGLKVFFSEQDLRQMGESAYLQAIDAVLERSRHMLVVTSSRENAASKFVLHEWSGFINEILSGRKSGNVVTLLCDGMTVNELPWSLRHHEARPFDELPGLLGFFR